jgi:hypothetical protein
MRYPHRFAICLCVFVALGLGTHLGMRRERPLPGAIQGVVVSQEQAGTISTRWRIEFCGEDVTLIPGAGLPLALQFDQSIVRIVSTGHAPHLTIGVQHSAQEATVWLARDPFVSPLPWRVVLLVDFAQPPRTGQMTVGTIQHDLAAQLATVSQTAVIVGHGCDEILSRISPSWGAPVDSRPRVRSERYSTQ